MFAKYQYNASATQANVQADIRLILTGTTNTASLSANCNTAASSITSTDVAGWTSYDTAAYTTNGFCIRALQQDGVTYKYFTMELSSTTNYNMRIAEAWDSGTHTGTNVVASANTAWTASTGGIFWIYATQEVILITHSTTTNIGFTNTHGAFELDNTEGMIPATYPTQFLLTLTAAGTAALPVGTACRIKNPNGVGDLTTTSTFASPIFTASTAASAYMQYGCVYRDSSENIKICFVPPAYAFSNGSNTLGYGYPGKVLGKVRLCNANYATPVFLDTIVIDGVTYVCFLKGSGTQVSIWVREG
jgi:hypothetical protein